MILQTKFSVELGIPKYSQEKSKLQLRREHKQTLRRVFLFYKEYRTNMFSESLMEIQEIV